MSAGAATRFFLVPSTSLGRVEDVLPERLVNPAGDWIAHSREILKSKRQAALRKQWKPTHPISEEHAKEPSQCPGMGELDSIGWMLKWPATAILRQATPKGWEIKPSSNFEFLQYSPLTSFPENGEAEAVLVGSGFTVVTPPGWSVLVKNLPNQIDAASRGLVFAEGVVRADQATFPLKLHALIRSSAKEIKIRRGDPMVAIFPFRREAVEMAVLDDPTLREEMEKHAQADRSTFAAAPGAYRRLYMESDNPNPLYPRLEAAFDASRKG